MRPPAAGRCWELRPKGLSSRPAKGTTGSPVEPGMEGGGMMIMEMPEKVGHDEAPVEPGMTEMGMPGQVGNDEGNRRDEGSRSDEENRHDVVPGRSRG